ncbi:N-acetylmuramidase domain-containing protein [Mesorhizobium australicum]|uniref:Putative peptidoglycan binding domain-containing protein n=1 Tax=Mesorhizobium australicum TaxID=536018 RepID=A0A1X7PNC3_9HYPH|nr:N-acetylmuramidase domain-containing protein [Mesorhizobium australicum]SMH52375.1 Putative peptidoglycan binding domain-containing protein [Mesorhizobium australicum]
MFSNSEIETIAVRSGLEPAALLAIAEVESAGKAFANVDGRREPLIRFEGHYFDRRLPAGKRAAARAAGLANPKAGAVKNPASQAARWAMLAKAAAIDHKAAHESVSWGLGQVMGAHWEWLDYASIDALVAEARAGAGGQVALMARFIEKAGLAGAIRRRDWTAFARGYNGPDYRRHGYDRKIATAYAKYADEIAAASPTTANAPLRRRSAGKAVRELQDLLAAAGYWVSSDGIFGPQTEAAVRDVQRARSLDVDGIAGPKTLEALKGPAIEAPPSNTSEASSPARSFWPWFLLWLRGLWRD